MFLDLFLFAKKKTGLSSVVFPPSNYRPGGRKQTAIFWFYHLGKLKVVNAKRRNPAYRRKITVILCFYRLRRSRYHQKSTNRLPLKNYRRMALPPKKYRHVCVVRSDGFAPLSRYLITEVQTHAGPFFSAFFYFLNSLFFRFFGSFGFLFCRIPC